MENEKPLAMAPAQVALHNLQQTIKTNIGAVVAAIIAIAVLVILGLTTRGLQSPKDALNQKVDAQVAEATQMLNSYEPGGQLLLAEVGSVTSQPEAAFPPEEEWPAGLKSLQERVQASESSLQPLRSEFNRLAGGQKSRTPSVENYAELKTRLDKNLDLIESALAIVHKAVNMSEEGPEGPVTGRSNPVATQLEAVLVYHQADLLRRRASMERDPAVEARSRFDAIYGRWQLAESEVAAIESVMGVATTRPAAMRAVKPARTKAAPAGTAVAAPAKKPAPGGRPGAVDMLVKFLFGGPGEKTQAPAPEATQPPVEEKPQSPAPSPEPETPAVVQAAEAPKAPTPEERLQKLSADREKALAEIAAGEADVARLREHKATLEKALASAQKTAREAQLRMMELKDKGVDVVEPGAMERFIAEYDKASEKYRAATREAALLEKGGIRNARPDTEDEQELLTAPLVPTVAGQPLERSQGLIAVRDELQAAEARLTASKQLLASIDTQIEAVHRWQKEQTARLASLRAKEAKLKEEATTAMQAANAAAAEADATALKAVESLQTQGTQAAQNAAMAAQKEIRDARAGQEPGVENARLELITKTGFLVGYAETLKGDLALMTAYIQAERANDLESQGRMLAKAEAMRITPDQQAQPAYVYQAAAALKEAQELKKQAIAAAEDARKVYYDADSSLKNLWAVQANTAAVYYLLAVLQTGTEAEKDCKLAIRIYEQALQDRKERPDTDKFRTALEGLKRLQENLAKQ